MAATDKLEFLGMNDRLNISVLGAYYREQRFTWDTDGNLEYRGVHNLANPGTSNASWEIWKFTWTSGNLTKLEGPLKGDWDSRATLAWG